MASMANQNFPVGSPQWWASRPQRVEKSGQRGRPSLSIDKIIATALEAVDEVGPQAFNMRMLAERLASGTATLYRHFASKDEILAYVVDHVLGELSVDEGDIPQIPWQQAIAFGAVGLHGLLGSHPNVVPLLVSQIPLGPNGLKMRERALSLLLANGFSPELAARAYVTIGHYVLGFAIQRHASAAFENDQVRVALGQFFKKLDAKTYPATTTVAKPLSSLSSQEEFHFGLKLIIDGLENARGAEVKATSRQKSRRAAG